METAVYLVFCMLLGGGQGNHLLDLVPSETYWKSKDVEVNLANILIELNSIKPDDTSKPMAVRKLMCIRTLGELKDAGAAPSLKPLLESKEMFVAEYAQAALDAIDGKVPNKTSGVPPDRMKQDLYMLPEHIGAVGQVKFAPGKAMTLPKPKEGEENAAGGDMRSGVEQMVNSLLYVAEMTGDIRVDGVTIGVSDAIGPQQGFLEVMVRGQWDADAVKAAWQPELPQTSVHGEVEFMGPQRGEALVAVPSNELFVITSAPNPAQILADDIGTAIKTNIGKFDGNSDLVKVIDGIDTSQPIWAAMLVSDNYRQAAQLAPFDNLTLVGKRTADGMKYEAKGTGKDADAVKGGVDEFTSLIDQAKRELNLEVERMPSAQTLLDFFNTIELKSDGTTATGTGLMKKPAQ
jgi:hypothetical protein